MHDVRSMPMRNNAVGRGTYASSTGAEVAEELFDEDGFSYKELLQQYSGKQGKSSKRQSDSNRQQQPNSNRNQSMVINFNSAPRQHSVMNLNASRAIGSYAQQAGISTSNAPSEQSRLSQNTTSSMGLLNELALKTTAHIPMIGTAVPLSNAKLASSVDSTKSELNNTNQITSEINTLSPNSDVYFNNVTVLRSAPSEANRENWLAGYAGKATVVSTIEVDGVKWAEIKTNSGKMAYVRADELSDTNPLVTPTGNRENRNVEIGSMMGVKHTVKLYKDTAEQGDYTGAYGDETGLEVLDRTIKDGEEWLKVKTCSNDVGWCKAEKLCSLEEKLHTINNTVNNGYELKLNVGFIPRSMIPNDLIVDQNGNIECKINAAYLKNSTNAHVYYDISGIAYGTRGAEAFDLSELNTVEIVGTDGFTPDGWVNFRLSDGRTITINMADLSPTKEGTSTKITGDLNNDGKLDEADEMLLDDYIAGKTKDVFNADTDGDGQIGENDLEKLKDIFLVKKYDLNNDGKLDEMDGAILRNERTWTGALTEVDKDKIDFNKDGIVDEKDTRELEEILNGKIIVQSTIPSGIKGDVNNDGKLDFADTYMIDKKIVYSNGLFRTVEQSNISNNIEIAKQADVNDDNIIDYVDLMAIKKATNNYSDISVFELNPGAILYSDENFNNVEIKRDMSHYVIFATRVLEETSTGYKIELQDYTNSEKKEYWFKKSDIRNDLTSTIDKIITGKMGIPIIPRGYNAQSDMPATPIINPDVNPNPPKNEPEEEIKPIKDPTITEEITDLAKIYHVNPGYKQGDYYKEEGGLFVTNISVDKDLDKEKSITFDVYNTKDAMGIIEYYDEKGNIIGVNLIDPHDTVIKDFGSWWEKARNTVDSIAKYGFDGVPITHPSVSKHINVEAPKGTHKIVVTNNANRSIYAQMYNLVDGIFKVKGLYDNVKDILDGYDAFKKDDVSKSITEKVKENIALEIVHKLQTNFSADKESLMEKIGEEGIKKWVLNNLNLQETFKNSLEYAIENSGKIVKEGAKSVVSKVSSTLLKGNPAIWGLEGIKLTGNLLDALSKFVTEKQLEKAKPMIFQFE